jgi:hypothetical protein
MCVTSLGRHYGRYVKGDVSIRDGLKENVSERGLGSFGPHGTGAGLCILLSRKGNIVS